MALCAIICEYNPFHNGHAYHIAESKKRTGADVICVMSGEFVQRGETAIIPTSVRAEAAVQNGADAVLRLPVVYSCSAAPVFARGAVRMLAGIDGVSYLSFGIECRNADDILRLYDLLRRESPELSAAIRNNLDRGTTYPRARAEAVKYVYGEIGTLMDYPNNLLALEYLSAIESFAPRITPILIPRVGDGYAADFPAHPTFTGATAIRALLRRGEDVSPYIPDPQVFQGVKISDPTHLFYVLLRQQLLEQTPASLAEINEVAEGLEYRILEAAETHGDFESFVDAVKSKRYTRAKLNRIFCNTLLRTRKQDCENALNGTQLYRVTAFRNEKTLSEIPNAVLRAKDAEKIDYRARAILERDMAAHRLYAVLQEQPYRAGDYFLTRKV